MALPWISLVVEWIGIHLPMQRIPVRPLIQEDSTVSQSTEAPEPQLLSLCSPAGAQRKLLRPTHLEPVLRNKRSHHTEKPLHRNEE